LRYFLWANGGRKTRKPLWKNQTIIVRASFSMERHASFIFTAKILPDTLGNMRKKWKRKSYSVHKAPQLPDNSLNFAEKPNHMRLIP
jgi:hypothetical protein